MSHNNLLYTTPYIYALTMFSLWIFFQHFYLKLVSIDQVTSEMSNIAWSAEWEFTYLWVNDLIMVGLNVDEKR